VLLRRLKAWGAVEKNGRRLRLINSSIGVGLLLGFGILDALLSWLQHRYPVPVQHVACALQWINVLTVHFIPTHIGEYVARHCAVSEISIPTIARIYVMLKITITVLASIIITFIGTELIFSGDKLYIKYAHFDPTIGLNTRFSNSSKMLTKLLVVVFPGVFITIYFVYYFIYYGDKLTHIDFSINFASTSGLWFCMVIPGNIVRAIYLVTRIMCGDEQREK